MTGKHKTIRVILTLTLPIILVWAFVETLCREMRSAFWYARNEVQQNIAAYRDQMRELSQ